MITARFYSSYFCVCCISGFLLWFLCSNRLQASFAVTYLSLWFLFYLTVILMTSSTLHPVFWSMVWYLLVVAQVPSMSIYDCLSFSVSLTHFQCISCWVVYIHHACIQLFIFALFWRFISLVSCVIFACCESPRIVFTCVWLLSPVSHYPPVGHYI